MAEDDLRKRLGVWLEEQGYPLEFSTAAAFAKKGFATRQGTHVDSGDGAPREVDVVACLDFPAGEDRLRLEWVVECKRSIDKPWVVFCGDGQMAASACVAQTIGSKAGRAILWGRAGDERLHELGLFATPVRPGFGGRQGFSAGRDAFYDALRSTSAVAHALGKQYDRDRSPLRCLRLAVVAFPVVVVRGRVFAALLEPGAAQLSLEERSVVRLHWKGSDAWRLHTSIDIVAEEGLEQYVATCRAEGAVAGRILSESLASLRHCVVQKRLDDWPIASAPRGFLGTAELLRELRDGVGPAEPHP